MSLRILCRLPKVEYSVRVMKANLVCAGLAALLAVGCAEKVEAPARPISQIKGKPINSTSNEVVAKVEAPKISTNTVATVAVNGFTPVGFDKLASFHYVMPDEVTTTNQPPADQFPATVKALDQKEVSLRGFMLPLKVEKGLVTEMLIMKDQSMCCYGTSPKINEWVSVKMADKGVKPVMDQPVTLFGKLRVGELRENGYLVGIYQLDGEKMEWE
jgi:hypothetical protein